MNSVTGEIITLASGTTNFIYTIIGCYGPVFSQKILVVNPNVNAGSLSGTSIMCAGSHAIFLTNGSSGGSWSSSNNSIATISSGSGFVSAISSGNVQFTYTVTGCGGTSTSTISTTVNSPVTAGIINSPSRICIGYIVY